jgi:hypothetical protein
VIFFLCIHPWDTIHYFRILHMWHYSSSQQVFEAGTSHPPRYSFTDNTDRHCNLYERNMQHPSEQPHMFSNAKYYCKCILLDSIGQLCCTRHLDTSWLCLTDSTLVKGYRRGWSPACIGNPMGRNIDLWHLFWKNLVIIILTALSHIDSVGIIVKITTIFNR